VRAATRFHSFKELETSLGAQVLAQGAELFAGDAGDGEDRLVAGGADGFEGTEVGEQRGAAFFADSWDAVEFGLEDAALPCLLAAVVGEAVAFVADALSKNNSALLARSDTGFF
jgi:hypothetical protein